MAGGEVPQIALLEIIHEAATLGVESSDADLAFKHVSPLGFLVPVQLTDDTLVETHVHAGQLLGGT
jgi:hypothetical protein